MKEMVKKENDKDRTLDSVGNGCRLYILGDLSRWIGHRTRAGITGVEIKSMIDLVLVKRDMLRYGQVVRAVRGMGRGSQTTMLYCVMSG